jgi:NAD(P) transhydrogenase subunit alpha
MLEVPITGLVAVYIFMLAAFTGFEVIGRVPAILHTPLMSGSNFVHGIVVVGALYTLLNATDLTAQIVGFVGVVLGAANAAGGFVVTRRMLDMFKASAQR